MAPLFNKMIGTILEFEFQVRMVRQILVDVYHYTKHIRDPESAITNIAADPIDVLICQVDSLRLFPLAIEYRFGGYHKQYKSLAETLEGARTAEVKGLFANRTCRKLFSLADARSDALVKQHAQRKVNLAADLAEKATDFMEAWKILWDLGDKIIAFEAEVRAGPKKEVVSLPHEGSVSSALTTVGTVTSPIASAGTPSSSLTPSDLPKEYEMSDYLGSLYLEIVSAEKDWLLSIVPSSLIHRTAWEFNGICRECQEQASLSESPT
jgi:hypothetical protein